MIKALVILLLAAAVFGTGGYYAYVLLIRPDMMLKEDRVQQASKPAPTPTPDPSLPAFDAATALAQQKHYDEARQALEAFLTKYPASSKVNEATQLLGKVNAEQFFTPGPGADKVGYTIQKGDAIAKIERKLKTSADLIMRTNGLTDPTKLKIGQQLWVPRADFLIKIKRPLHSVVLFNHGHFFKQYESLSWRAPEGKLANLTAKVTEKAAWKEGARVAFGSKDYDQSYHWIILSQAAFTIFADSKDPAVKIERPNGGIGVSPEDAEEIATLVNRNTPVIID